MSLAREKPQMVRPLSRKDIFYSGSVLNLPQYQSKQSLASYRQSVVSIPKASRGEMGDVEKQERTHFNNFEKTMADNNL